MILRTNTAIVFKRREIPKGKELVVGVDITKEEAETLLSIGEEISIIEYGQYPVEKTSTRDMK